MRHPGAVRSKLNRQFGERQGMVTTNNARMLGVARQPFCGKCCGEHTKRGNVKQKRAARRSAKQQFNLRDSEADNWVNEIMVRSHF